MKFKQPFNNAKLNEYFMKHSLAYKLKEFDKSPFIKAMPIDEKLVRVAQKARESIISATNIGKYLTNEGNIIEKQDLSSKYNTTTDLIVNFINVLERESYKDIIEVKKEARKKQNQKPSQKMK